MALIKCPECGKQISNMADECPHCGYPLNNTKEEVISSELKIEEPKNEEPETAEQPKPVKPESKTGKPENENSVSKHQSTKRDKPSKDLPKVIGGIIGAAIVCILLCVFWPSGGAKTFDSAHEMRESLQGVYTEESLGVTQFEIDGIRYRLIKMSDDNPESLPYNLEIEMHPEEGTFDVYYDSKFIEDNHLTTYKVLRNGDIEDTESGSVYKAGSERFTGEETEYPDGTEIYGRVLEIKYESASADSDAGTFNPKGSIVNNGKETYTDIVVEVISSDEDGYEVGSEQAKIVKAGDELAPGESVNYDITCDLEESTDSYRIEITKAERVE